MKASTKHKTAYAEAVREHEAAKRRYESYDAPADHPVKRQLYLRMVKAWDKAVALSRGGKP